MIGVYKKMKIKKKYVLFIFVLLCGALIPFVIFGLKSDGFIDAIYTKIILICVSAICLFLIAKKN
jgi:hypothetical protein